MTPSDVKIVADNIGDFIEVPDGIERLRKAVLTLAVSGMLVTQDKKEGTAEELYKKIQTDRLGRTKKAKEFALVTKEEIPFEIPESWKWVHMGDVGDFGGGSGFPKEHQTKVSGGVPFFKVSDMNRNIREMRESENWITEEIAKKIKAKILPADTIIFPKIGGAIATNKRRVLVMPSCIDNNCLGYIPNHRILGDWMFLHLTNIDLAKYQVGSSIPALNIGTLDQILVSLPPLAEQKRIVKKVEEMMKQLDALEAKKRERDEVRTRLARSAMQSLGKGDSKVAFEQLTELIKTPADLKELEGALLTLAVSGKLVPQNNEEGTADDLLSQSNLEQEKNSEGRKRKAKVFSEVTSEKIPFKIPKSWKWVRLGSVFTSYSSGSTPSRGNDEFYRNGKTNWYKSGELNDGVLSTDSEEKITDIALEKCHLRLNKRGDLLIAMYGATAGRVAMFDNVGTTNQAVWGGTPDSSVDLKYLFSYILQSRHQLLKTSSGAAQPNISGEKISAHVLPLPPHAEQKRIVKKVEEVMTLVAQLREAFGESKAQGRGRPKK